MGQTVFITFVVKIMEQFDIGVIGGGMVGLASAWKIAIRNPALKIAVFEKEAQLSSHQTGRNSGVIHSGIYYKPGSYKAKNCVEGRRELVRFSKAYNIPHDICGKLIVATHPSEFPFLEKIYSNGQQNGIEGTQWVTAQQIQEIEPHCTGGIRGIHVGCTGIIDFPAVVRQLGVLFANINSDNAIYTGHEVIRTQTNSEDYLVHTSKSVFSCKCLVYCGGLQSDRLALQEGVDQQMRILGFRGDYYDLSEQGKHKVNHLIYPVPNPQFPFLGVHFTRMIQGGVECGPNAVFTFKREGYGKLDFSWKDTAEALSFKGTWKFLGKHWKFGLDEYRRAFSKKLFHRQLQKLIPDLTLDDLIPGRSGIRAMALDPDGQMVDDFRIVNTHRSIHVLNAPSPAATAGLAIGEEVAQLAHKQFNIV
jgi:L-2-hydroxyglutarate oxidase LhgO